MKNISAEEKQTLLHAINTEFSNEDYQYLKKLIQQYNIIDKIMDVINEHKQRVEILTGTLPDTYPIKHILPQLTAYIINRKA